MASKENDPRASNRIESRRAAAASKPDARPSDTADAAPLRQQQPKHRLLPQQARQEQLREASAQRSPTGFLPPPVMCWQAGIQKNGVPLLELPGCFSEGLTMRCARGETEVLQIPLRNCGLASVLVDLSLRAPALRKDELSVKPAQVELLPGEEKTVTAVYRPSSEASAQSVLELRSSDGLRHDMCVATEPLLSSWLAPGSPVVAFGGARVGEAATSTLVLANTSDRAVSFQLEVLACASARVQAPPRGGDHGRGLHVRAAPRTAPLSGFWAAPPEMAEICTAEQLRGAPSTPFAVLGRAPGAVVTVRPRERVELELRFAPTHCVRYRSELRLDCWRAGAQSAPRPEQQLFVPLLGYGGVADVACDGEVVMDDSCCRKSTGWCSCSVVVTNSGARAAYVQAVLGETAGHVVEVHPHTLTLAAGSSAEFEVRCRVDRFASGGVVRLALRWGDELLRLQRERLRKRRGVRRLDEADADEGEGCGGDDNTRTSVMDSLDEPTALSFARPCWEQPPEALGVRDGGMDHFSDESLFEQRQNEAPLVVRWAGGAAAFTALAAQRLLAQQLPPFRASVEPRRLLLKPDALQPGRYHASFTVENVTHNLIEMRCDPDDPGYALSARSVLLACGEREVVQVQWQAAQGRAKPGKLLVWVGATGDLLDVALARPRQNVYFVGAPHVLRVPGGSDTQTFTIKLANRRHTKLTARLQVLDARLGKPAFHVRSNKSNVSIEGGHGMEIDVVFARRRETERAAGAHYRAELVAFEGDSKVASVEIVAILGY